jgi:hypothetical protein
MSDRVLLSLLAVAAVALVALAAVWPQGYGARSPGPFGHTPIQQTPEMQAAMARAAHKQKPKQSGGPGAGAVAGLRPTQ